MRNSNLDKATTTKYDGCLMNTVTRLPLNITKAKGSRIYDSISKTWMLDFFGDGGVLSMGYNSTEIKRAMRAWKRTGMPHQLPDVYPNEFRRQASRLICEKTELDKVFFINSGTEAVEASIKLARKYWCDAANFRPINIGDAGPRHKIYTIDGNFHGRTGFSLGATDDADTPYHKIGFGPVPKGFGVLKTTRIDGKLKFFSKSFNTVIRANSQLDWLDVGAIILSPVLARNDVRMYSLEFMRELAEIRRRFGVLLIFDDILAGSGMTGEFATWKINGIKPDIMTLGKGMAMGFPMSACVASKKVATAFTPGTHFNTHGGSPFACFMMLQMWSWLEKNIEKVKERGAFIYNELAEMDWIASNEGVGFLNTFTPDFKHYGYDGYKFTRAARYNGLSIVTFRPHGGIRFTPPLNTSLRDIKKALKILQKTHESLIR